MLRIESLDIPDFALKQQELTAKQIEEAEEIISALLYMLAFRDGECIEKLAKSIPHRRLEHRRNAVLNTVYHGISQSPPLWLTRGILALYDPAFDGLELEQLQNVLSTSMVDPPGGTRDKGVYRAAAELALMAGALGETKCECPSAKLIDKATRRMRTGRLETPLGGNKS